MKISDIKIEMFIKNQQEGGVLRYVL
jgi:hypothetical protein